jgi:enterochelin esterase-like enzyme
MNFKTLEAPMIRSMVLLLIIGTANADGTVSDDIRITSRGLGYDLQYRIYLPEGHDSRTDHPVIFLTDGQNYIRRGQMPKIMNSLISNGKIEPVVAVFVDPRDPDDLQSNRRRSQFLCNVDYLNFFITELIPAVERDYPVMKDREGRSIMGLSFGGTNSACFGVLGYDFFSGIAMQSPANHPVPNLLSAYQEMPTLPLRIFLSTGVPDDNTRANRQFHTVLKNKNYDMEYVEVKQGHNWENWGPLIDDVLLYFYGTGNQKP